MVEARKEFYARIEEDAEINNEKNLKLGRVIGRLVQLELKLHKSLCQLCQYAK